MTSTKRWIIIPHLLGIFRSKKIYLTSKRKWFKGSWFDARTPSSWLVPRLLHSKYRGKRPMPCHAYLCHRPKPYLWKPFMRSSWDSSMTDYVYASNLDGNWQKLVLGVWWKVPLFCWLKVVFRLQDWLVGSTLTLESTSLTTRLSEAGVQ